MATGSAFVQFKTQVAALKCLVASEQKEGGVQYEGQRLNITVALPRSDVEKTHTSEKEDKRNLFLAKEGGEFYLQATNQSVSAICYVCLARILVYLALEYWST